MPRSSESVAALGPLGVLETAMSLLRAHEPAEPQITASARIVSARLLAMTGIGPSTRLEREADPPGLSA
jgi:hypothetical protein